MSHLSPDIIFLNQLLPLPSHKLLIYLFSIRATIGNSLVIPMIIEYNSNSDYLPLLTLFKLQYYYYAICYIKVLFHWVVRFHVALLQLA